MPLATEGHTGFVTDIQFCPRDTEAAISNTLMKAGNCAPTKPYLQAERIARG